MESRRRLGPPAAAAVAPSGRGGATPSASSAALPPSGAGSRCSFPRTLRLGAFGGDAFCLAQFLAGEGLLDEPPTGHFGTSLRRAVAAWQAARGGGLQDSDGSGVFGAAGRALYARLHGLPQPGSVVAEPPAGTAAADYTCLDVQAQLGAHTVAQTRCAR